MPRRTRRSLTHDVKLAALKRMAETDNIHRLAKEPGIERKMPDTWRDATGHTAGSLLNVANSRLEITSRVSGF